MIEDFLDVEENKKKKEKNENGIIHFFMDELKLDKEDFKLNINFSEGKSIQDVEVVYYES